MLDKLLVIGFPLMPFVKLSYRFTSESIPSDYFLLLCCSLEQRACELKRITRRKLAQSNP